MLNDAHFHAVLTPEPAGEDRFHGRSLALDSPTIYGGQLMAQVLGAAAATLDAQRPAHYLQCDFVAPGDPGAELLFEVRRVRDGRSTSHRAVEVSQGGRTLLLASLSFQDVTDGFDHQAAMPAVESPRALQADPANEFVFSEDSGNPFPFLMLTCPVAAGAHAATSAIWARPRAQTPRRGHLHQQLLAFLSDATILQSALLPHALDWEQPGLMVATMNHAIWFHRPLDIDNWLLMYSEAPSTGAGRALATANLFDQGGALVATVAQEGVLRTRQA